MRILRISLLNLNSLKGEHLIDFTVPPLSDNPLYAIVGPTGAGKTTILDAITLALYGQTERNKKETDRADGVNSVMTHGTTECRAELEYVTPAGRYRSVWRRHRAHRRTSGKLVKSQHEISKYHPETEEYTILATKKKQVAQLTEEIVGLNYERFVRSVMLTQGAFDRFLKSDAGDKSAILEQITGTEIYRQLSEGAYRRYKQAREACDRATDALGGALPLADDARHELEDELRRSGTELQSATDDLALVTQQLSRYATVTELEANSDRREKEMARAQEQWNLRDAERARLAANDRLEVLRAKLEREASLTADAQRVAISLTTVGRERATATEQLDGVRKQLATAGERLADFRTREPAREKKILAAQAIEQDIRTLLHERESQTGQLTRHQRSRQQLEERRSSAQRKVENIRTTLGGLTAPEIETETQALERDLPAAEKRLAATERALEYHQLLAQQTEQLVRLREIEEKQEDNKQKREAAERDVKLGETQVDLLRSRQENARLRASLEEHRRCLEAGQACPLCGALDHPYLQEGAASLPSADALVRQLTETQNALTEADNRYTKLVREEAELAARQQYIRETADATAITLEAFVAPPELTGDALHEQREALLTELAVLRERMEQLRKLRPLLPELRAEEASLSSLLGQQKELDQLLRTVQEELTRLARRIAERTGEKEELIGKFSSSECRERLRTKGEALAGQLAVAERENATVDTRLATLNERAAQLGQRSGEVAEILELIRQELAEALEPLGLDHSGARKQLLPPPEIATLRQQLQLLDRQRETATVLASQATAELNAARERTVELDAPEQLQERQSVLKQQITATNQHIGALKNQLREDDKRALRLRDLRSELELLERDRDRWADMNELIGSADGKKFRSFAQSITLQRLVHLGNRHLETISPRYRMVYAPPAPGDREELNLEIVDTYMNDNRRTMSTLSGGESFLVSLALALALADLAGGKQLIQSLFIDEGFGTLDGKTLDQAMITLEQLQAQGKTVGIISHVQQLRERVHCQIRLEPVGDGFSRVELTS